MKGWRLALSLLCWTVLAVLWGAAAQAAGFSSSLTVEEGGPGTVVEVAVSYDGTLGDVAAFQVAVAYDGEAFSYQRASYGESVKAGTAATMDQSGQVSSVYTAPGTGPFLASETVITYRFQVKEEALAGSQAFTVSVFQIASPEPAFILADVEVSLPFQVLAPPSSDARLLSLRPDHGALEPEFDPDVFSYTMTVPYEVTAITFTAEPVPGAVCRVNRKNLGAGGSDTLFEITVTAEDGETRQVYEVTVHRNEKEEEEEPALSDDARLLSLVPASGTLTPAFDPDQLEYTLTVPFEITTMTFSAEPVEGAAYRVNRKNLGAGGSDTVFKITVTAADGETKRVYEVTVHRNEKEEEEEPALSDDSRLLSLVPASGTLTPAFDPDRLEYTLTVPFEVTTMTFTAKAAEGATYRVNRKNLGAGGSDTVFEITVTAADGETKRVYEVTVHRSEKVSSSSSSSSGSGTGTSSKGAASSGGQESSESGAELPSGENAPSDSEQILPVAGITDDSSSGGEGSTGEGQEPQGLVFQNGETSALPGMLVLLAFLVFCFLSGPIARELAKRFPEYTPAHAEKKNQP